MTNSAALVKNSIWRKPEFRALPRMAQCTYTQLLGLKDIDRAGIFPLNVRQLVRGCDELSPQILWADLRVLEESRWVFVDEDTDEGFIRHYMKTFEIRKYPQYLANAYKGARMLESTKLRVEVAKELRLLKIAEATAVADEIDPSGTVPPPSAKGDSTVHGAITVEAPTSSSTRSSKDLLVSSHFGEDAPRCSKHLNDPDPPNCWACKRKREARDVGSQEAADKERQARAAAKALADACPICEGTHWIPNTYPLKRCTHQEEAHA